MRKREEVPRRPWMPLGGGRMMKAQRLPSVALVIILFCAFAVSADLVPVYERLQDNLSNPSLQSGSVVVYDQVQGEEYGKAEVKYSVWQDAIGFWHYNYQIVNNYDMGTPSTPTDDYHFGWLYAPGYAEDPAQYVGIYKMSLVNFGQGDGASDLVVLGSAGSTKGGNAWTAAVDPGNTGIDWVNHTGQSIDPTRWVWVPEVKGKNPVPAHWETLTGNTSTGDGTSTKYFQLASTWAPALVGVQVLVEGYTPNMTLVQLLATGQVLGPAIEPVFTPEPATCLLLGLGGMAFIRMRKR